MTELTRRTFLKDALAAAGLAPGASSLARRRGVPSQRGATAADSPRRDERVLIIGAGMAGLAAAAELRALGFADVAILEARDRIGGRIWTDAIGGNIPVDLGASWIHGVDGNPITAIATGNGIATHPTDYDNDVVHFHDAERPSPSARRALRRFWRFAERQPDTNLQFVYERLLEIEPLTAPDRRYLEHLLNTIVEHEQAADLRNLSLESIRGGDEYGGDDAVFPGGYGQVADVLADGLDIRFLEAVTEIDYAGTDIVLTTAAGATFEATRVVVTVPLGVLKQNLISFLPALPLRKRGAIDGLEMGVLNKTCLLFDDVFWDNDVELIGYVGARERAVAGDPQPVSVHGASDSDDVQCRSLRRPDRAALRPGDCRAGGCGAGEHVWRHPARRGCPRHTLALGSVGPGVLLVRSRRILVSAIRRTGRARRRQAVLRGGGDTRRISIDRARRVSLGCSRSPPDRRAPRTTLSRDSPLTR